MTTTHTHRHHSSASDVRGASDARGASSANCASKATGNCVRAAYGAVVNVRSVPTRSVTRIEIEIPIEAHVEATRVLYGRDVWVVPANADHANADHSLCYGMVDVASPDHPADPPLDAPVEQSSAMPTSVATAHTERRVPSLGHHADVVDILRWLGARCREDDFQVWLGVRTEAAAVERVRSVCAVRSRTEIAHNPAARRAFFDRLFHPFLRHQRASLRGALTSSAEPFADHFADPAP